MRCVLVGNYGVGNVGDEALKEYFLSAFPEVQWTVVTASGVGESEVPRLPLGFRSLLRPWWRTIRAIAKAEFLVFGGGSLFTDVESVWACVIWRAYAVLAELLGTPYILAFQGAGPWQTALGKRLAEKTYRKAVFVSVRDAESASRVIELCPSVDPVQSFDPAYALFKRVAPSAQGQGDGVVLIPRSNPTDTFFQSVRKIPLRTVQRILLLEPEGDRQAAEELRRIFPDATVVDIRSVQDLLSSLRSAASVVTQRYHGAMAALAMQIPVTIIPQKSGDKLDALRVALESGAGDQWINLVLDGEQKLRKILV